MLKWDLHIWHYQLSYKNCPNQQKEILATPGIKYFCFSLAFKVHVFVNSSLKIYIYSLYTHTFGAYIGWQMENKELIVRLAYHFSLKYI